MSRPVLNMKPDGSFNIMGTGKGKSLPGYKPVKYGPVTFGRGNIELPSTGQLAKGLAHLGLRAASRFNPWLSAIDIAFELAYDLYNGDQIGYVVPPTEEQLPGLVDSDAPVKCVQVCSAPTPGRTMYKVFYNTGGCPINEVYRCLPLQVAGTYLDTKPGNKVTISWTGAGTGRTLIFLGPEQLAGARMKFDYAAVS